MELNKENRVNYYLNNLSNLNSVNIELNTDMIGFKYDKIFVTNYDYIQKYSKNDYFIDVYKYISESNIDKSKLFLCRFGDAFYENNKLIYFSKIRKPNNYEAILLNLDTTRHISMLSSIKSYDIPFNLKNNKLIWRGASTGNAPHLHKCRDTCVLKFQNHPNKNIDIKYNFLCQGYNNVDNKYILGETMGFIEQLESKFLLSIEGNDVATNLKWALLSNSVVLMPTPTVCSWYMEDQLVPFVHYVPIKSNFDDLEEKYNWCLNNLEKCKIISENGTKYIKQFMNVDLEREITSEVINTYLKKVKFTNEESINVLLKNA